MPKRIQLSRAKGYRMPAGAVIVDRRSDWGNAYRVVRDGKKWARTNAYGAPVEHFDTQEEAAKAAVGEYRASVEHLRGMLPTLRGKDLACWCALPAEGEPDVCHAAVLLELANATD